MNLLTAHRERLRHELHKAHHEVRVMKRELVYQREANANLRRRLNAVVAERNDVMERLRLCRDEVAKMKGAP